MTFTFTVPLVPPSVNHYKGRARNGHWYVTDAALDFKSWLTKYARNQRVRAKSYHVEIVIYLGAKQKGDVDNFSKCVLDGLVEDGVIDSDAKITDLILRKRRDRSNPRTEISITGIESKKTLASGAKP